ncbi:hypothetical protein KBD18_00535 [Patescibacteria group bacterium]|nr:hypothetical protein [Patescibacteria group bacterium]
MLSFKDNNEKIGFIAAIITSAAPLGQVWKTIRTGEVDGISFWMWFLQAVGVFLWMIYGIRLGKRPVIIANGLTLISALVILFYVVRDLMG